MNTKKREFKFILNPLSKYKLYHFIGFFAGVLLVLAEWWLRTAFTKDSGVQFMLFFIAIPLVTGVLIGFIFPGKIAAFNWGVFLSIICVVVGSALFLNGRLHVGTIIGAGFMGVAVVGVTCVSTLLGETLEMIVRKIKQRKKQR